MQRERAKHNIEFLHTGDGRTFLNYWDWAHGQDVCCEIKDSELWLSRCDENGEELPDEKITLQRFLELVEQSIDAIKI